ncbi:ATP-binding protein [uncultured Selenomonas sp.]|uniref:ATP-binding protein n=1 Tax=uncultured Selenomonas sp. TaxID=159275 RepID=UPI0025FB4C4A|nr:ATP-binding protein [uncultured Selenomonas sp.]
MERIARPAGMAFLRRWREKPIIKVISGLRRCGKSTLLALFKDELLAQGVKTSAVQFLNFEDLAYESLKSDYHKLYEHLTSRLQPDVMNYIFLDEIQNVASFEKVVDSLYLRPNIDLYLTGSNAYFLSGELATLLSGRYVEYQLLPLSFAEYCTSAKAQGKTPAQNYRDYISTSALPFSLTLTEPDLLTDYLRGTYSTIVLKDIVARLGISDISMLESVTAFLMDAIGNLITPRKIADTMTSMRRKIDPRTVEKYLRALTDSLLLYRAQRYDLRGKQLLANNAKYYVSDLGFRRLLSSGRRPDYGHVLENVVYLELLRRGYSVRVGQLPDGEIDFVAMRNDEMVYYQVSLSVLDEHTLARELAPLQKRRDNYPKILLTLDEALPDSNYDGILQRNVLDWLLDA